MAIFKDIIESQKFTLVKSTPFDCGIVELHNEPTRNRQIRGYKADVNLIKISVFIHASPDF
jgi:hypothetical protein